jgi:hypothetical protein
MKKEVLVFGILIIFSISFVSAEILFQENFEDSNVGARGWYDYANPVITNSEHVPGSTSSIEFHFNPTDRNPTGRLGRHLFTDNNSVYISYWVKYSNNWVGSQQSYHPHEYYFLTNMDGDWVGPASAHIEINLEQNHNTVSGMRPRLGLGAGGSPLRIMDGPVMFTDAIGPGYKNDWHFIEAYFEMNSGVDVADGIAQYWFDDQLIIDENNVVYRRVAGDENMMFRQLLVAPYIGVGSPVSQTIWVDNLTLGTEREEAPPTFCPDGVCNGTETCNSCSQDCGVCCGNTICEPAYGEDSNSCPTDCPEPPTNATYFGDLNNDSRITISDILIIMGHILQRELNWAADVDEDGEVNIFDLVKVARIWGKQYETDTTAPTVVSSMPSQSILPLGTTEVIVGVETDERAICRYNPTPTDFASMIDFYRTGGIQHTKEETGLLDNQNYLYYVQCRDEAGNLNSTDYLINFSVGPVIPSNTTPPIRSSGSPSGTLVSGTTSTTISLTTNENATCKYDAISTTYALMSNTFSTTGTTSHSQLVTGLFDGNTYTYYVRCEDSMSNENTDDFIISFSIESAGDTTPPSRSNGAPSGLLASGTTQTTISLNTDEAATCGYSINAGTPYGSMTTLSNTGGTSHSQLVTGLSNGNSYNYHIRCEDSSGNANTNDYTISFGVSSGGYATPDILDGATFSAGNWEGFVSNNFGTPTGVELTTEQAYDGTHSVKFEYIIGGTNDVGGQFSRPFGTYVDEVNVKIHFYITGIPDNTGWKFIRYRRQFGTILGGLLVSGGRFRFAFEDLQASPIIGVDIGVPPLSDILNEWHSIEVNYRRHGDPSGYPSAEFWFDGQHIGQPDGPALGTSYWQNGRLYAGTGVGSSNQLSLIQVLAEFNRNNHNPGEAYVDLISISSLGRIG